MRKNKISALAEVKYLKNLTNLKVLWLWDNPCCEHSLYRLYVIKYLPNLEKLDNACVTTEERMKAKKIDSAMESQIENSDQNMDESDRSGRPTANAVKTSHSSIGDKKMAFENRYKN